MSPSIGAATASAAARGRAPPLSRANAAQAEARPGMLARPVFAHLAEPRAFAGAQLGEREAGMGAADIGRDDLHQRFRRPSIRSSTRLGSASVEVSPSAP